jgi:DNA-binding MarR family transcriptional regulator
VAAIPEPEQSFYDLLAIARLHQTHRMRVELAARGFADFRRGDGAWVRILGEWPRSPGEVAAIVGISRQAATKMADALEARGYVERAADDGDRRRVVLSLSERGRQYERAIVEVVDLLDEAIRSRVPAASLEIAARVLEVLIADGGEARDQIVAGDVSD